MFHNPFHFERTMNLKGEALLFLVGDSGIFPYRALAQLLPFCRLTPLNVV